MGKPIDITGQKFGRLIANKHLGYGRWECKCDCGAVTVVQSISLREGRTKSCGCLLRDIENERIKNTTEARFGRLTPVKRVGDGKWECVCDCGNTKIVYISHLKSGRVKSCGCLRKDTISANPPLVKMRMIYKESYGNIQEDQIITPLDGNALNTSLDNLFPVKKSAYYYLKRNELLGLGDLTKTAALAHELYSEVKKIEQ